MLKHSPPQKLYLLPFTQVTKVETTLPWVPEPKNNKKISFHVNFEALVPRVKQLKIFSKARGAVGNFDGGVGAAFTKS